MGSDFCSCQHFFVKTENESNMLSYSKKDLSTIDKKNSMDKRFDEESVTNDQQSKVKTLDINKNTHDTSDKQEKYLKSPKKKSVFDINNFYDDENKENENNINVLGDNVEKNQIDNNINIYKSPFKKTFTFKDIHMKSNGENTDKNYINSNNYNKEINNNDNNSDNNKYQENQINNMLNQNDNNKILNKEEINIKSKINEEDGEYTKSLNDKNTKNSKLNINPFDINNEKDNIQQSNENEIKEINNISSNDKSIKEKEKIKESDKITTDFLNNYIIGKNNDDDEEDEENELNENNKDENNYASNDDELNDDSNSNYMYNNNNNKDEESNSFD